jgi:hypothetical protein
MMKVLVAYSWDDDISQRRYMIMQAVAKEAGYDFAQCFVVPSPRTHPSPDVITDMISTAVHELHPDVLLIHTGAVYHRAPDSFAEAVRRIHQMYPALRLGVERRPELELSDLSIFEQSEEMQRIERTFFG